MACLEDYPIIEDAINYAVNVRNGIQDLLTLQIARFWVDGWITGRQRESKTISEEDIKIIYQGIDNWIWF